MDCPICFETIPHNNIVNTICNHKFCKTCLDKWKNTTNSKNKCPSFLDICVSLGSLRWYINQSWDMMGKFDL